MIKATEAGQRFELNSPTEMPRAAGFLWNRKMMIHMNCRGFATAQFLQPEPAKYIYAPNLEAKTFMQPEQPYYAHHPGRFFYIKDELSGEIFSAPFEPARATPRRRLHNRHSARQTLPGKGRLLIHSKKAAIEPL